MQSSAALSESKGYFWKSCYRLHFSQIALIQSAPSRDKVSALLAPCPVVLLSLDLLKTKTHNRQWRYPGMGAQAGEGSLGPLVVNCPGCRPHPQLFSTVCRGQGCPNPAQSWRWWSCWCWEQTQVL